MVNKDIFSRFFSRKPWSIGQKLFGLSGQWFFLTGLDTKNKRFNLAPPSRIYFFGPKNMLGINKWEDFVNETSNWLVV